MSMNHMVDGIVFAPPPPSGEDYYWMRTYQGGVYYFWRMDEGFQNKSYAFQALADRAKVKVDINKDIDPAKMKKELGPLGISYTIVETLAMSASIANQAKQ